MQICGRLQLQPRSEEDSNMGLSVRSMIRYVVHILHYSSHEKDICEKILIGKAKTIRNNYNA